MRRFFYLPFLFALTFSACQNNELVNAQTRVEVIDNRLQLFAAEDELLNVDLASFSFRENSAIFNTEFGMFDIVERAPVDVVVADRAETSRSDDTLVLSFFREDQEVASGSVRLENEGHFVLEAESLSPNHNRATFSFGCESRDHFMGLGAHTHDVDFRGQRVPLWVSEQGIGKTDDNELPAVWQLLGRRHTTHIPIPAMVTSRNTAVVLETSAYSIFDLCASDEDVVTLEAWEPKVRLHVFVGDSMTQALSKMNAFVGRPPLPAPWMHAPWNDAIFGSDTVRAFANFLRDEGISSSAIWSEDWKGGNDMGDFYRLEGDWRLDRELYPDYEEMTDDLRDLGFMHQLYFNTFVTDSAEIYDDVQDLVVKNESGEPFIFTGPEDGFRDTILMDLTNEETRAFVKNEIKNAYDFGSRGHMADYGEWLPVDGAQLASGEDPALYHNRYSVEWQKLNAEVIDEEGLRDEAIVFARSGHLFAQKYTQVVWAGDQRTDFQRDDGLPTVIPMGLGLSAAGYLFYAHDIAGYQSGTNDPATKELFFRWTELGAFTPIMRTHHGTHARFNHNLQSDEESTQHWKRYANLHTRLYPYVRGLAVRAVDEGIPLWLPLGMVHPLDDVFNVLDQYYFGDHLMVAPVVTDGARERDVIFASDRYVSLFGEQVVEGPTTQTIDAPLGEIPVFMRAGAIVPLTRNTPLTLLPGREGLPGLESTEGDREVYIALGKNNVFAEQSGALYTLEGEGTDLSSIEEAPDADGFFQITGNDSICGTNFCVTLSGHPSERTTYLRLK